MGRQQKSGTGGRKIPKKWKQLCTSNSEKVKRVNVDTHIIVTADGTLPVKCCTLMDSK